MTTEQAPTKSPRMDEDAISMLAASIRGDILRPGDGAYDEARRIYNGMVDRRPALIVRCAGVSDVVQAVQFAKKNGIPTSIRAGGHNVAGNALVDDGLVIDLTHMKGVVVDPEERTALVAGGATWGDLDSQAQAFGLATTGGLISSTGVAGLTLGGGLGWLMRKHGMAIDNLLSAELVNAEGEVISVSEDQNSDLFWALRGAGHNFGVVTSLKFRLHPVGSVLGGMLAYPVEQAPEVLRHYRDFGREAPDDLTAFAGLMTSPEGERICAILVAYFGEHSEGERLLQPLRNLGRPALDNIGPMPYTTLQTMLDDGFPHGIQNYWKSSFLRELPDELIDLAVDQFRDVPSPLNVVMLEQFGGAVARVAPQATAFQHRDSAYNLVLISRWEEPGQTEENIAWVRRVWRAAERFTSGVYVNYLGADEADRVVSAYGTSYDRLVPLKAKYDPDNFFRTNQNISPAR